MPEALPAVVSASLVGVVAALVVGRWLTRLSRTGAVLRQLDEMQTAVVAWQLAHRGRIRGLERKMTDIEIAVMCAEDDAHTAALRLGSIRGDLLRRIEEAEQQLEIQVLVDQGRIPREHLA